ncbi:hypothetical protein V1477_001890, partial [Vespula maculifrons]
YSFKYYKDDTGSVLLCISTCTHHRSRSLGWGYMISRDGNKIESLTDFDNLYYYITHSSNILYDLLHFRIKLRSGDTFHHLATNFNEYISPFSQYACPANNNKELIMKWCSGDIPPLVLVQSDFEFRLVRIGVLVVRILRKRTDFDSYWFSLTLNFDEYASSFSRYTFSTNNNKELVMKWCGGDTFLSVTPMKSDFDSYWFSLVLNFDEYTSSFSRYAFSANNNKELVRTDFDSYWFSLALNFDEYTSQFSRYAFSTNNNKELVRTDFDSYWFSLTLNFDEYTSLFSRYAFSANNNKELMRTDFDSYWFSLVLNFDEYTSQFSKRTDFDSYWFSLTLNFDEYTSQFSRYAFSTNNNKELVRTDFDSYWFSLTLNFDEYTSPFSRYAFSTNNNKELIGVAGISPTRDDNIGGPTLTATGSNLIAVVRVAMKLRAMQSLESVFVRVVFDFLTVAQTVLIKDSRVSRNKFSDRSLINNYRELESVHHRRGFQPTSMSTYLIFNQLQIIHPQFRPKSRSSVLEPSQNFLSSKIRVVNDSFRMFYSSCLDMKQRGDYMSKRPPQTVTQEGNYYFNFTINSDDVTLRLRSHIDTTGRVSRCLKPTVWTVEQSVSGVLYISTRSSRSGKASRIVDFRVESPLARGSSDAATSTRWDLGRLDHRGSDHRASDHRGIEHSEIKFLQGSDRWTYHRGILTRKHDRSCLEMSEADGVDGGAICKRGFIHLQFAEKLEAPEAERHLGSWILE